MEQVGDGARGGPDALTSAGCGPERATRELPGIQSGEDNMSVDTCIDKIKRRDVQVRRPQRSMPRDAVAAGLCIISLEIPVAGEGKLKTQKKIRKKILRGGGVRRKRSITGNEENPTQEQMQKPKTPRDGAEVLHVMLRERESVSRRCCRAVYGLHGQGRRTSVLRAWCFRCGET